ncbi:MAG: hypothetical protein EU550_01905 [Promethearchaeota archaeon]|nr:MAG: hypothetical protein EU550_01905 [Candidatus Lokiarchaeota archaeon]
MVIPEELVESVPEEEMILFVSNNLDNKRVKKIRQFIYVVVDLGFFIILLSIIIIPSFPDWIQGDFGFLDLFLILISIGVLVFFSFLLRMMVISTKKDMYFLITDRSFYLYNYKYEGKSQFVEKFELTSIIGLEFDKYILNDKGDYGNLKIILKTPAIESDKTYFLKEEDTYTPIYQLKNIPNLSEFQKKFESILYEFGNIRENWIELEEGSNVSLPKEFQISQERLIDVKKRGKRQIYYAIGIPLISMIAFLCILFLEASGILFSLIDETISFIIHLLGIILGPLIAIMGFIGPLMERREIQKRTCRLDANLIIQDNYIIHRNNNSSKKININELTNVKHAKIKNPYNKIVNWEENIDGVLIQRSYDSEEQIIFGPIDNFSQKYAILFNYCILWKANNGLLLKKGELIKKKLKREDIITQKRKRKISYSKLEPVQKQEFTFEPRDPSGLIYNKFKNYLNPDEKVLLTYKSTVTLKRNIILILISIAAFIGLLYLAFTDIWEVNFLLGLFGVILPIVIPIFCCLSQICSLSSKWLQKDSIFVFTTEKILANYSNKYAITPYQNIDNIAISRSRFHPNVQDIMINLKTSLGGNPLWNNYMILISKVPDQNALIEKIRYIKDNLDKINQEGN